MNTNPSAEDALHAAICNAVILLNNGEEIAPRVSSILRTALAEYEPTPKAAAGAGLVDGLSKLDYSTLFNAIAYAARIEGRSISISVARFKEVVEAAIGREVAK